MAYSTYLSTALVKRYGLKEGDTVSLFSPNTVWYPVAMFAALRVGAVMSGASPAYNVEEMAYALKTARSRFLMTVPGSMGVAAEAAEKAGLPRENVLLLDGELEGFVNMRELLEAGKGYGEGGQVPAFRIAADRTNRDTLGFLSFSSGTTGLPKAVMISHANMIGQCLQVAELTPDHYQRTIAVLPFFHITGLVHLLHLPVYLNVEVYMLPSYKLETMLEVAYRYKIADWHAVPPIIIQLTRAPEALINKYDWSFLKRIMSGAAPLSAEIVRALEARFPGSGLKQGYGMTESCSCITMHSEEFYNYKYAHYAGVICPSTLVKIVDPESGKECGLNEEGEIWAKGPQIVMGYLNNEKATRETFDGEGYLHTGDIGKIDEDGLLLITDRLKEMIKVKGIAVAPAELEDLLLGHDLVDDCAVIGIRDELAGERPKAYVVLKTGDSSSSSGSLDQICESLIQYVKDRKDRNKSIIEIEVVEQIPKSASGKILRKILRAMTRDDAEGKTRQDKGFVYRDNSREVRSRL